MANFVKNLVAINIIIKANKNPIHNDEYWPPIPWVGKIRDNARRGVETRKVEDSRIF